MKLNLNYPESIQIYENIKFLISQPKFKISYSIVAYGHFSRRMQWPIRRT